MRAAAAGLVPQLVEPQQVARGIGLRAVADFLQHVDQRLELVLELGEDFRERALRPVVRRLRQRTVGAPAHGDVVIDVHRAARETAGEEAGDEERDVAQALQRAVAVAVVRRFDRLGEHERERLEARVAAGPGVEQRVTAREHREQVDDVLLGVVAHGEVLVPEREMQRVAEELAHVGYGQQFRVAALALHRCPPACRPRVPAPPVQSFGQGHSANCVAACRGSRRGRVLTAAVCDRAQTQMSCRMLVSVRKRRTRASPVRRSSTKRAYSGTPDTRSVSTTSASPVT